MTRFPFCSLFVFISFTVCGPNCQNRACSSGDPQVCCHPSCIGGCTGELASECVACVNIAHKGTCVNKCPYEQGTKLLDYLDRRCISVEECLQKKPELIGDKYVHYKTINGTENKCKLECPPNSEEDPQDPSKCKVCSQNRCPKVCKVNKIIQNIADAQSLKGCVKIESDLVIQTRGGGDIVDELTENLKDIEVISGFLKIYHSPALVTLNFLSKLHTIEGNNLERGNYSIYILDNPSLEKLFENRVPRIKKGKGFFHINPKLCQKEIEALRLNAADSAWNEHDVSKLTNGDRIECEVVDFKVEINNVSVTYKQKSTSVQVSWNNVANKFNDHRNLLGYTINYRRAERNITKYDGKDACSNGEWLSTDINQDNATDTIYYIIPHLAFHTRYAVYIETIGYDTNQKAESELRYFTTPEGSKFN